MQNEWRITVTNGLKAHFRQPNGLSLPGTDWVVELQSGVKSVRVMVRAYTNDVAGLSPVQESQTVAEFVGQLLQRGWTPENWQGKSGELTLKRTTPPTGSSAL